MRRAKRAKPGCRGGEQLGSFLGYVRAVARRTELELEEPIVSILPHYEPHPLLRDSVS